MAATITPTQSPQGVRSRTLASTMLLSQWLAVFRPDTIHLWNCRLGPTPHTTLNVALTPQLEGMLRRFNLYADALSISPTTIEVIEAKVVADAGAISQVETYMSLVPSTPALKSYTGRVITGTVVFATDSDIVRQKAVSNGLAYYVFTPPWIEEYLLNRYYRVGRS